MAKNYLVFGKNGQLARGLATVLAEENFINIDRAEADFMRPATVVAVLEKYKPKIVFNAVAYTAVDLAETEREQALRVNCEVPGLIARWCRENSVKLVHFSTDYVFSGTGREAWREDDITRACNYYGASKRDGERAIENEGGNYLIFRTSWVFDAFGKNFFNTVLRLAKEREEITIVNDQIGAPTYAPHLAAGSLQGLKNAMQKTLFPSGIYHLCAAGETNWYEFAKKIIAHAHENGILEKTPKIIPINSEQYPTKAARPINSKLDCGKSMRILSVALPDWESGLIDCFKVFACK